MRTRSLLPNQVIKLYWLKIAGFFGIVWLLAGVITVQGQIIRYVKPTPAGVGDGTSWSNASADLQAMLFTSGVEQVWVAGGIYKPGGETNTDRTVSFSLTSGVQLYGGFVGTETSLLERPSSLPSSTTLSGDIGIKDDSTDNSYHVVVLMPYYQSYDLTRLDGFVITKGRADAQQGEASSRGGGLYMNDVGYPTITNCDFINNSATWEGGGLYAHINGMKLIDCSFINNSCLTQGPSGYYGTGGGLYSGTAETILNCSFLNNVASFGGGMVSVSGNVYLTNCSFLNNAAQVAGALGGFSNIVMTNCIVWQDGQITDPFWIPPTIDYSILHPSMLGYGIGNNIHNIITSISPFVSEKSLLLNACSPAINTGNNSVSHTDVDGGGNNRIIGGRIDMGAFEYQGTPLAMYTVSPGLWNDPASWSCGRVPSLSDSVQLKHSITIPSNYQAQALRIKYDAGQQLLFDTGSRLQIGQ